MAMAADSLVDVKAKVLQLAAVTDRGGMADPGSDLLCFLKTGRDVGP